MPWIYGQLRALAQSCAHRGGPAGPQATVVVHEAWLKLLGGKGARVHDREHFLALAARAMRQICLDEARARRTRKRGGDAAAVTIDEALLSGDGIAFDMLDFDAALTALAAVDERGARVVELRLFGGLLMEDIATTLAVSLPTVEREWRAARAWLASRLSGERRSQGD